MHRIDGAGHVNNLFVSEDPATNRPPTEITPEIMNAFQEELVSVVLWALGALDKNDNTQLKQALLAKFAPLVSPAFSGTPSAPTPAQFDNDTSLATTEFVQKNGLRFGFSSVVANRNLTVNDIGNICWFSGGYSVTMPTPTSLGIPVGATVTFYNTAAANATVTAGAGVTFDALASPVTIKQGEFVIFVATSISQWTQFGIADLSKTGSFSSSLPSSTGGNGYFNLPGGFIMQFGTAATSNGSGTWTFPIAFPNGCFGTWVSQDGTASGAALYACGISPRGSFGDANNKTGATIASGLTSGGDGIWCFAIGK